MKTFLSVLFLWALLLSSASAGDLSLRLGLGYGAPLNAPKNTTITLRSRTVYANVNIVDEGYSNVPLGYIELNYQLTNKFSANIIHISNPIAQDANYGVTGAFILMEVK